MNSKRLVTLGLTNLQFCTVISITQNNLHRHFFLDFIFCFPPPRVVFVCSCVAPKGANAQMYKQDLTKVGYLLNNILSVAGTDAATAAPAVVAVAPALAAAVAQRQEWWWYQQPVAMTGEDSISGYHGCDRLHTAGLLIQLCTSIS